ncbi:MAG: hypothetical protein ACU0DI_15375 [Paracoccaceae bacterium]
MAGSLQPDPILQSRLTDPPWALRSDTKLPGTGPVEADGWIRADDAFAGQMALRDRLIAERQEAVHSLRPAALYWVRTKNFCDINHDPKALGRVRPPGCQCNSQINPFLRIFTEKNQGPK